MGKGEVFDSEGKMPNESKNKRRFLPGESRSSRQKREKGRFCWKKKGLDSRKILKRAKKSKARQEDEGRS